MIRVATTLEYRVLVLAPVGQDAALVRRVLEEAGVESAPCADMEEACRELECGAAALLLTEEVLREDQPLALLREALSRQPPWSDLPVLTLISGGTESPLAAYVLEMLGNVMLVERPVLANTLVSVVRAALRARQRQYKTRGHLAALEDGNQALRESEERFRTMADSLPQLAWIARADGYIFWYNRRWYEYTGATAEQMEGWGWQSVHDPQTLPAVLERWKASIATDEPFEMVFPLRGVDGRFRRFLTRVMPMKDAQGRVAQWFGTNTDVDELKRSEEALRKSERHLSLAQQAARIGSFDWNIQTNVNLWTPELEAMYGLRRGEFGGTQTAWERLVHPEDRPSAIGLVQRAFTAGHPVEGEWRVQWPDGSVHWIFGRFQLFRDEAGRPLRLTGVNIDITGRKRDEEALRQAERLRDSERRLADIINFLPDATFALDREGRIIAWNKAMETLTGAPAAEVLGKGNHEYTWRLYGKRVPCLADEVLRGDRPGWTFSNRIREEDIVRAETFIPRFKPGGVWLSIRVAPINDAQGNIIGVIDSCRDITERKRIEEALRESEKRFSSAFEDATIGMALVSPKGKWLKVNRATCDLLGYSENELLAGTFQDITHPDDLATDLTYVQQMLQGEIHTYQMEKRYFHKMGHVVWALLSVSLVRDQQGAPLYFIPQIVDITERKRAENALQKANEQLAEADKRKDEFLAMLAHELRNPLAPIRNAVQVLKMIGPADEAGQRQHNIINRQVTHMARLLDDLLDISRVTRGKVVLKKQPLPLHQALAHAVETVTPVIEARHHVLTVEPPPEGLLVEADPDRLAQVIGNLLANAAKYMNEGGRIWLSAAREEGQVVIRVRDTGVGIAPEILPKVFDLFTQASQTLDRAQGGLGIGLTMVKSLVEMHGGAVEARSVGLGQGSEFIVRLPALVAAGPAPSRPEEPEKTANFRALRLLVVDDVADSASSLAELLRLWGHEVRAAFDGQAALQAVRAFQPEVVFLDIAMPGLDGYETARRLRAEHGARPPLLVALSGYGQESDIQKSLAAGFDHHLVKPVDLAALCRLLSSVFVQGEAGTGRPAREGRQMTDSKIT